ncbi:unnamed protein product [Vitrella brassicaformis CCMP3155]|uniref:Uncharacterized protein n=2 Tax=Vitrella brassicaformis TaxID=1169539 RepID=A0A0G4EV37_VITBC|nr:unnamed protein product [Vitrella brassicaformis CCMP3155]|eukprot:CEM01912.1 unnamed protein product [Vitrella brassicaformis CCMP3155]
MANWCKSLFNCCGQVDKEPEARFEPTEEVRASKGSQGSAAAKFPKPAAEKSNTLQLTKEAQESIHYSGLYGTEIVPVPKSPEELQNCVFAFGRAALKGIPVDLIDLQRGQVHPARFFCDDALKTVSLRGERDGEDLISLALDEVVDVHGLFETPPTCIRADLERLRKDKTLVLTADQLSQIVVLETAAKPNMEGKLADKFKFVPTPLLTILLKPKDPSQPGSVPVPKAMVCSGLEVLRMWLMDERTGRAVTQRERAATIKWDRGKLEDFKKKLEKGVKVEMIDLISGIRHDATFVVNFKQYLVTVKDTEGKKAPFSCDLRSSKYQTFREGPAELLRLNPKLALHDDEWDSLLFIGARPFRVSAPLLHSPETQSSDDALEGHGCVLLESVDERDKVISGFKEVQAKEQEKKGT